MKTNLVQRAEIRLVSRAIYHFAMIKGNNFLIKFAMRVVHIIMTYIYTIHFFMREQRKLAGETAGRS